MELCLASPAPPSQLTGGGRQESEALSQGGGGGRGVSRGRRIGRSEMACPMLNVKQSEITKAFQFLCCSCYESFMSCMYVMTVRPCLVIILKANLYSFFGRAKSPYLSSYQTTRCLAYVGVLHRNL